MWPRGSSWTGSILGLDPDEDRGMRGSARMKRDRDIAVEARPEDTTSTVMPSDSSLSTSMAAGLSPPVTSSTRADSAAHCASRRG